jgi:aminoglycoside 3-N-acetyltransferase I
MIPVATKRLTVGDHALARAAFVLMADVFDEHSAPLSDSYLERLLARTDFWAFAALRNDVVVGGITAYTLPLTRAESSEVFIYDIAVHPEHQRGGVGRALVTALRSAAAAVGIHDVFVPADNDDTHALDFYQRLGGQAAQVTFFTFAGTQR